MIGQSDVPEVLSDPVWPVIPLSATLLCPASRLGRLKGNRMGGSHFSFTPKESRRSRGLPLRSEGPATNDSVVSNLGRRGESGRHPRSLLHLQRTAGNAAVTTSLASAGHAPAMALMSVARQTTPLAGETYAPREPPLRAPATVDRAKKLKVDVDQQTEPLVASALMLSEVATPVIEQFSSSHAASLESLRQILRPWVPESGVNFGTVLSFAIGLSLLPIPARGFYAVAKELAVELTQTVASSNVSEAQQAIEAARTGMVMASWLEGTQPAGEVAMRSRSIVRQNYDTAAKLQLAVLRPWNDLVRAEAGGDQSSVLKSAARFVQVAPTFIREAKRASEVSGMLVLSYLIASLENSPRDELHRKMAVVLPDVMQGLQDRKGVLGMQGADARGSFVEQVLVHFYEEVQPRSTAIRWQTRHSIADIHREGASLFRRQGVPAKPGPEPTMEYHGNAVGEFRYERTTSRLHDFAERRMQMSLLPVDVAIDRQQPWVLEPSVIVSHSKPRPTDEVAAVALTAAGPHAAAAHEHWARIAGAVP